MAETKAKKNYHWGTGRRKTSVARVRLIDGTGKITVNDRPLDQYFSEESHRKQAQAPLELVEMRTRLDMFVNVRGGGYTGQAGAICQGAARALKSMFAAVPPPAAPAPAPVLPSAAVPAGAVVPPEPPAVNPIIKKLRDSGYLTRDGRMKERKKYGRKGARKAFQFSKR